MKTIKSTMKMIKNTCKKTKLLVLILVLMLPVTINAQEIIPQEGIARKFLMHLVNKEVGEMLPMFSEDFLQQVPEGQITEIAQGLETQLGPFKHVSRVLHETDDNYHTVILVCRFGEMDWGMRITLDRDDKVAGFFLTMAPPESYTPPPAWIDSTAFEEVAMEIDCGDIKLPAMFAKPLAAANFPVVVLVHGSGAHDMDQTIGPNKIFRDIAQGLANKGVGVLRYEKRNFRHPHTFDLETVTVWDEAGRDAVHAIHSAMQMPEVDPGRVFLLGHSLGGMIAPRIAAEVPELAGIISLAGTPRKLYEVIPGQLEYLMSLSEEASDAAAEQLAETREIVARLRDKIGRPDAVYSTSLLGMPPSYLEDMNRHDTGKIAAGLPQAILIVHGGRDYQVTMDDYNAWKNALQNHHNSTFKLYPEMDHLFVARDEPSTPASYFEENNVDKRVIEDIADWIRMQR